jgi:hypothetical protein
MRILVTGSRDWEDVQRIEQALLKYHPVDAQGFDLPDEKPTLVSGACPKGADRIAEIAAKFLGWYIERHPAHWLAPCRAECKPGHRRPSPMGGGTDGTFCPSAGHYRNQEMVDLGADVVLAFNRNNSRGTADCVRRAKAAGLKVIPFNDNGGV